MASRRKKEQISVSFFSFLDIMTSTMGTLILVLICITLISMKKQRKKIYIKLKSDKAEKHSKKPIFVECTQDRLLIYPQLYETPLSLVEDKNSHFMRLLYSIDRNKMYIIFAVRPDGVEIFKKARSLVEKMDIGVGFEPVDKYWEIKLDKEDLPPPIAGFGG